MRMRIVLIVLAGFAVGAFAALALLTYREPQSGIVATTGKAQVGGPFSLVDHDGNRVTDEDFRGRLMLVFFGFTFCPDICPTELQVMSTALEQLGPEGERVVPIFITIDPERDGVEEMAAYVSHFHPRMVGLTGSEKEIADVARAYRVYYAKVDEETNPDGYLMDHSTIVYLMDEDGRFAAHFNYGESPDRLAARIAEFL